MTRRDAPKFVRPPMALRQLRVEIDGRRTGRVSTADRELLVTPF